MFSRRFGFLSSIFYLFVIIQSNISSSVSRFSFSLIRIFLFDLLYMKGDFVWYVLFISARAAEELHHFQIP